MNTDRTSKHKSQFTADEALKVSDQYDYLRSPNAPCSGSIYHAMWALADEVRQLRASSPDETSATPAGVLQWAEESFGQIARNRDERAARLAEEAMEVAQAEGVPLETLTRIADRIYSRPVGELGQEVGGLGITLYALAANCGLDLFGEIEREWKCVLSKPREWWRRKHAEKVAAGTADLSPIQPEEPACDGWKCMKCGHENPKGALRCQNSKCTVLNYSPEKASGYACPNCAGAGCTDCRPNSAVSQTVQARFCDYKGELVEINGKIVCPQCGNSW